MLIEIKDDIIDNAIEKEDSDVNEALDLLLMMAFCAKRKKHILSIPCFRNQGKRYKKISLLMGRDNLAALNFFNTKTISPKQLMNFLTVKSVISYSKPEALEDKNYRIIWVNPLDSKSFEPWVETFVLTENLLDSEFFAYLIRYYLRQNDLNFLHFNFYALMGGGGTMDKVLEKEILKKLHFCMVIADSDKKFPTDSIGDTAKKVQAQMKVKPFNCGSYVMTHVREIENLIPKKVVHKCGQSKDMSIFYKDPSFFDMKIGLCLSELFDDRVYDYWKQLLNEENLFDERNRLKNQYSDKESYNKASNGIKPIVKGYGSGLLSLSLNKSEQIKKQLSSKNDLYSINSDDLNGFQKKEWTTIGRELLSWTCCLKDNVF